MGDDIGFLNKEIRKLDRQIRDLEKELKFKDEMIAAMNIHGPALEQEIKDQKIEIIKLKDEIRFITE